MQLDILKKVEDMDKKQKEKDKENLEEEVKTISISQLNIVNRSINSTDIENLRPKFDKIRVKCYNYWKTSHYAKDCWNPTKKVGDNGNVVVE